MAKRDMLNLVKKVKGVIPEGYDINAYELTRLKEMIANNSTLYDALTIAFEYGYILGHRATKAGRYTESRR